MAIKKQHWPAQQNLQLLDFFYWLCLSRSCLTHLMSMGQGALLFLAKSVTRNWTDWQDTQAVLFLLTLPHISFFVPFWAKYVTKNCASRRYTQIMSGQGHNMVILLFLYVYKLDRHPFRPSMILCLFLLKMQQESYICGCIYMCVCLSVFMLCVL